MPHESHDYRDTFLDVRHAAESFISDKNVVFLVVGSGSDTTKANYIDATFAISGNILQGVQMSDNAQLREHTVDNLEKCVGTEALSPPYKVTVYYDASCDDDASGSSINASISGKGKAECNGGGKRSKKSSGGKRRDVVLITPYSPGNRGPYAEDIPPRNTVRFTPFQVSAIRSGLNKVCSMCVVCSIVCFVV